MASSDRNQPRKRGRGADSVSSSSNKRGRVSGWPSSSAHATSGSSGSAAWAPSGSSGWPDAGPSHATVAAGGQSFDIHVDTHQKPMVICDEEEEDEVDWPDSGDDRVSNKLRPEQKIAERAMRRGLGRKKKNSGSNANPDTRAPPSKKYSPGYTLYINKHQLEATLSLLRQNKDAYGQAWVLYGDNNGGSDHALLDHVQLAGPSTWWKSPMGPIPEELYAKALAEIQVGVGNIVFPTVARKGLNIPEPINPGKTGTGKKARTKPVPTWPARIWPVDVLLAPAPLAPALPAPAQPAPAQPAPSQPTPLPAAPAPVAPTPIAPAPIAPEVVPAPARPRRPPTPEEEKIARRVRIRERFRVRTKVPVAPEQPPTASPPRVPSPPPRVPSPAELPPAPAQLPSAPAQLSPAPAQAAQRAPVQAAERAPAQAAASPKRTRTQPPAPIPAFTARGLVRRDLSIPEQWDAAPAPRDQQQYIRDVYDVTCAMLYPFNTVLIGSGTHHLPLLPTADEAENELGDDGYWSRMEWTFEPFMLDRGAPWLCMMKCPSEPRGWDHKLLRRPKTGDFRAHSIKPHLVVLRPSFVRPYDELLDRLVQDCRKAMRIIQRARNDDSWSERDARVDLFDGMALPLMTIDRVERTLDLFFRSDDDEVRVGFISREHGLLWWDALLRAARELVAYIEFGAILAPKKSVRRELRKLRWMKDGFDYRGFILDGRTAPLYYNIFSDRGLPVYALLWLDAIKMDSGMPMQDMGSCRVSINPGGTYNNVVRQLGYRLGSQARPPPAGINWRHRERVARGRVARPDAADQKQRADESDKQLKALLGMHTKIGGKDVVSTNPIFMAIASTRNAERPSWAPPRPQQSENAFERSLQYISLLPNKKKAALYLTPPLRVYYAIACDNPEFLNEATIAIMRLRPYFEDRVATAQRHSDASPMRGLTAKEWKGCLTGHAWYVGLTKEQRAQSSMEGEFWVRGNKQFLGDAVSRQIAQSGVLPTPLADMACSCPVTKERVRADESVYASCAHFLEQQSNSQALATIAQGAMQAAGVGIVFHGLDDRLRIPDLRVRSEGEHRAVTLIRDIVFGGPATAPGAWPSAWSAVDHYDVQTRRNWIGALREFIDEYSDLRDAFVGMYSLGFYLGETRSDGAPSWRSTARTRSIPVSFDADLGALDHDQLDIIQQEYLDRFATCLIAAGAWPSEFSMAPEPRWAVGRCALHRVAQNPHAQDDSDEEMDV